MRSALLNLLDEGVHPLLDPFLDLRSKAFHLAARMLDLLILLPDGIVDMRLEEATLLGLLLAGLFKCDLDLVALGVHHFLDGRG